MNTPMTGSRYNFVDEDIPFLAIVLKGSLPMYSNYINFEANKTEYFLKLVEQRGITIILFNDGRSC